VLLALARLPQSVKLRVIGYETASTTGYMDVLRENARDLGILQRVELSGPISRFELIEQRRKSDIGLALMPMKTEDINLRAMTGASNKAFAYRACGLALAVSDLPPWRTLYVEPGYGVACDPDEPISIERALGTLLSDPNEIRAMGERGRQRVAHEWNYETQFAKVLEVINATPAKGKIQLHAMQPPATDG